MRAALFGILAAVAPLSAHAFCGTYVGGPGDELYSGVSQVVLARTGTRTVLTMVNDVEGDVTDFAMVIPVPEVLSEDDVSVIDPVRIEIMKRYTDPRVVTYVCDDFAGETLFRRLSCNDTTLSFRSAAAPEANLDVTVEAEFAAGEYDIVVLSSEDSGDLLTWLDREGYGVSPTAADLLGEYVASGSYFMAAKVRLEDVPRGDGIVGRPFLSPLQIAYDTTAFSLPIRLGTLNSPGTQDLVVYAITDLNEGSVGIANYPEAELATDCLYDEARHGELETFIGDQMDEAVADNDGVAWVQTYSWSNGKCDPCPDGIQLDPETVTVLGFPEDQAWNVHTTRVWMRYDAEAATEDVVFYTSGGGFEQEQLRYIVHEDFLEDRYPVCLSGFAPDPGTCRDDGFSERMSLGPLGLVGFLGLLGVVGVIRRRRD